MKQNCNIELKISEDLLRKFLFVSSADNRTPAAQFAFMVRNNVAYYEKTKGKIPDAELKKIDIEPYKDNARFCKRYDVLPGMFCTVDLDLRATADRETQFEMDAEYVDNMSLRLDVKTFFGIISTVVIGKNVYKDGK